MTKRIVFILIMAGLGGLLYGIDFGTIAAAMPYIRTLKLFTDAQLSLIVGAVLFGGIVSSLSAGVLCEKFGRKRMIIVSAGLFLVAIPIVCLSGGLFAIMFLGRVLQGMSAGYMALVMPMYVTETLPAEIRGRGTGVFQFFLSVGLVLAATIGFIITTCLGQRPAMAWQMNFWWTLLPVAILFFGAFFLEESPVWRVAGTKRESPCDVGCDVRGVKVLASLCQRKYVVPFLLAVLVLTFNKTTGMSSITSYSVVIFQKAGFTGALGNVGDFAIKLTNLLVTVCAAFLIDRKGRIFLLKIGTAGMTLGMLAIGGVFCAIERFGMTPTPVTGVFCLAAFFFMQVFYALGPAICVWLVLSELMPMRIRANGMAIALFMNQLVAWALASSFLPWVNAWGWDTMFLFFAINGVLYFVTTFFIPETKGKTLWELEHLFDKADKGKTA